MTNKEKLPLFIDQLIKKGTEKITELSKFEIKISIEHAEKVSEFQIQELSEIVYCRTTVALLFSNEKESIQLFNKRLDKYEMRVRSFPAKFPVEK